MRYISQSGQFKEIYDVNTTACKQESPVLRVQSFCHSESYRNWKHMIGPAPDAVIAFLILSGSQSIRHPDRMNERIEPGYFAVVDLDSVKADYITVSLSAERYFILLEKNHLLQNLLQDMFPGGLPAFQAQDPEALKECFENIRREIIRKNASDPRIGSAAYRLLHEAALQLPENELPRPLVLAKNYISNHFQEPELCREDIARAACVSISTLAGLFKKHLGITIRESISQKRMESVRQMLLFSNKSISEIAEACGFSYSYYLAREFKKVHNMTPGAFRKQKRLIL